MSSLEIEKFQPKQLTNSKREMIQDQGIQSLKSLRSCQPLNRIRVVSSES